MKCEICGNEYAHLGLHINLRHKDITQKEYYDRYLKTSREGFCYTCGTPLPYVNLIRGYKHYCNSKCELADPQIMEKAKQTYKIKTGYDHNMHNPESKARVKKTTEEKYGGIGFASKELAQKVVDAYNEQNGTDIKSVHMICHSTPEKEQQRIATRIMNNGGSYMTDEHKKKFIESSNRPESIEKRIYSRRERYGDKYMSDTAYANMKGKPLETYSDVKMVEFVKHGEGLCTCHCDICGNDYQIDLMTLRTRRYANQVPCTVCNPIGSHVFYSTSDKEQELYAFIKSLYSGKILQNDRSVLDHKELDIYLPEKKLAFEFDGIYWHNEVTKENNYHLNKTEECGAKGIRLIHIFEDDWKYKQDIVKSRIGSLLGLSTKVYARKCTADTVPTDKAKEFLDKNHLQGSINSKYKYGLYDQDGLVALMTFGKCRYGTGYEIYRYCSRLGTNVVGGASRLFSKFLEDHPEIDAVTTFADRCWSNGGFYEKLGFLTAGTTPPAYYYVIDGIRENRQKFQKHKLVAEGFDPSMSEHEIMLSRGIYRIYDCGNLKYVWHRS